MKRVFHAGLLTTAIFSWARADDRRLPPPPPGQVAPGTILPRAEAPRMISPGTRSERAPDVMEEMRPGLMPPVPPDDFFAPRRPMLVQNFAWAFVDVPRPREIKEHDIVTIIVKEVSETNASSRYNRQRNGSLKAELKEFIRFGDDGRLLNAADNQPTIDANLQGRLQSTGQVAETEGIKYRIAATVVDVLPNGVLVLEARKTICNNGDLSRYTLTGKLRPQDIGQDNTALSEHVAELHISKDQSGKLHDSTQRTWGLRLYDLLSPF